MEEVDLSKYIHEGVLKFPDDFDINLLKGYDLMDSLNNINILDLSNLKIKSIPSSLFIGCDSLSKVILPTSISYIEDRAFADCNNLKYINLEELKNLKEIGYQSFTNTKLKGVIFPENLQVIKEKAFEGSSLIGLDFSMLKDDILIGNNAFYQTDLKQMYTNSKIKITQKGSAFTCACQNMEIDEARIFAKMFNEIDYSMFSSDVNEQLIKDNMNIKLIDGNPILSLDLSKENKYNINILNKLTPMNWMDLSYIYLDNIDLDNLDKTKEIVDTLSSLGSYGLFNVVLRVKNPQWQEKYDPKIDYLYSKQECKKLNELNDYLVSKNLGELLYQEGLEDEVYQNTIDEGIWRHSKVIEANSKIDDIVDNIKSNNLSPLEAMIYIHSIVGKFEYKKEYDEQDSSISRNIVNPLTKENPEIVCVGYAALTKAIIDKLDMPGLKCDLDSCAVLKLDSSDSLGYHLKNIIVLDDDKNNIHGAFNYDACYLRDNRFNFATFLTSLDSYNKGLGFINTPNGLNNLNFFSYDFKNNKNSIDDRVNLYNKLITVENKINKYERLIYYKKKSQSNDLSILDKIDLEKNKIMLLQEEFINKENEINNSLLERLDIERKNIVDKIKNMHRFEEYKIDSYISTLNFSDKRLYEEFPADAYLRQSFNMFYNKLSKESENYNLLMNVIDDSINRSVKKQKLYSILLKEDEDIIESYGDNYLTEYKKLILDRENILFDMGYTDKNRINNLDKAIDDYKIIQEHYSNYDPTTTIEGETFIKALIETANKVDLGMDKEDLLIALDDTINIVRENYRHDSGNIFFDPYIKDFILQQERKDLLNKR